MCWAATRSEHLPRRVVSSPPFSSTPRSHCHTAKTGGSRSRPAGLSRAGHLPRWGHRFSVARRRLNFSDPSISFYYNSIITKVDLVGRLVISSPIVQMLLKMLLPPRQHLVFVRQSITVSHHSVAYEICACSACFDVARSRFLLNKNRSFERPCLYFAWLSRLFVEPFFACFRE